MPQNSSGGGGSGSNSGGGGGNSGSFDSGGSGGIGSSDSSGSSGGSGGSDSGGSGGSSGGGAARLVALATGDGRIVNSHFGSAPLFVIAEVSGSGYAILELRENGGARENGAAHGQTPREHNQSKFEQTIALVSDCGAVIAAKIGRAAAGELQRRGVQALEQAGAIEDLLARYAKWLGKGGYSARG
jgi:predicted Fe-Mo cluster-binding NifX family protein